MTFWPYPPPGRSTMPAAARPRSIRIRDLHSGQDLTAARAQARPVLELWREHAYGSLACRLACGFAPGHAGAPEHACVYLRDPPPARIDVGAQNRACTACWG